MSKVLAVFTALFFIMSFSFNLSFAENPTPHNEWDFDFTNIQIAQNPSKPSEMIVSTGVIFKGEFDLGTVNIFAEIIEPDGTIVTHFGDIVNTHIGKEYSMDITHFMTQEGQYTVNLHMSPPGNQYTEHVFDEKSLTYVVPKHGLEKKLGISGIDFDDRVSYLLDGDDIILDSELIHVLIDLPKIHAFETISVTNGEFIKSFPTNTKDLYLSSEYDYDSMRVNLIKEGNLLSSADAQHDLQDFVKFSAVNRDICKTIHCLVVDYSETNTYEENFQKFWIIIVVLFVISIVLVIRRKKNLNNNNVDSYIHPDHQ